MQASQGLLCQSVEWLKELIQHLIGKMKLYSQFLQKLDLLHLFQNLGQLVVRLNINLTSL